MAINVNVQYNGGLLPDSILLTQCCFHRETRLNAMKRFCIYLQPLIPPKRFDIFSPLTGGCSEYLGAFRFFFKNTVQYNTVYSVVYQVSHVFSSHLFWASSSLDVPAGVTQEEGHT